MDLPLQGKRVLITGVGLRKAEETFYGFNGAATHLPIPGTNGVMCKGNIGAACAFACAQQGAIVHMVARSEGSLKAVQRWLQNHTNQKVEYTAADVNDPAWQQHLVQSIPDDLTLYWIQSVGMGAGTVTLPDDNPYVPIEEITPELFQAEHSVTWSTIALMQLLLPRFRAKGGARICIITSMSAIRSFSSGSVHMSAKAALSRWTNAAMLELNQERIRITDVRPGGVDTGFYDSPAVQETVIKVCKSYGYDWSKKAGGLKLICPLEIGTTVAHILGLNCHVPSINIVGHGQMPHEGS